MLFRLVSLVWTLAVIGIAAVAGAFIFANTLSLLLAVIGIVLVLFIGIGPLKAYQRWAETRLLSKPQPLQLDPSTAKSRTFIKWRKLSLGELLIIQAIIAIVFGYLFVSVFPKVPLLSACVVSIVFAMLATLLLKVIIAWMSNPIEALGFDLLRKSPSDKHDSE
jgi:hypothetical protein